VSLSAPHLHTRASTSITKNMDMANSFGRMVHSTLVTLNTGKEMDTENTRMKKRTCLRASGRTAYWKYRIKISHERIN